MKKVLKYLLPAAAAILVLLVLLWQNGVFAPKPDEETLIGRAHFAIRCDLATSSDELSPELRSILPEDGLLGEEEVQVFKGDTAFSVLARYCKEHKIPLSSVGSTRYGLYVDGIGGLYEHDCGSGSGWMFSVNGEFVNKSAGDTEVKDWDDILWVYTLDLGKDVGDNAA